MFDVLNDLEWLGNPALTWIGAIVTALVGFLVARTISSARRPACNRSTSGKGSSVP